MIKYNKSNGKTSGQGITKYFCTLFESNELLPKKKKLTDYQIAVKVSEEFPDRPTASLKHFIGPNKKHTINSYRYRYNRGDFTKGIPPKNKSFRYNKDGERVNGKSGNRILTPQEIEAIQCNAF